MNLSSSVKWLPQTDRLDNVNRVLVRKSYTPDASTRLLRARLVFKKMDENKLFQNSSLQKAAENSGVAGEFCCLSLRRSQISRDL